MARNKVAGLTTEPAGDRFKSFDESPLKSVASDPVSTFSIDVDTASYSYVRASLSNGILPPPDAVRIEEMLNYFPYDYPAPTKADVPFSVSLAAFPTPWNARTELLRIGIKGYAPPPAARKAEHLVFLIDTSGSMDEPDKLPLLKRSFALLAEKLGAEDTVAIVAYAGSAGVVLEPTKASDKAKILSALDSLDAGGATAGAEGIELAYRLAEQSKQAGAVNRVILATDGDFNVGIADPDALKDFIRRKRDDGITLSVLGFGRGNLDDALMQALAQNGNGNASYIDSYAEARKVLVEEAGGTLDMIAKDVKIQLEFNPALVSEYRLIGYETRSLAREDFNNDKVDAGDIGAGHTVTALYEITPAGKGAEAMDALRYPASKPAPGSGRGPGRRARLPQDPLQAAGFRHQPADRDADPSGAGRSRYRRGRRGCTLRRGGRGIRPEAQGLELCRHDELGCDPFAGGRCRRRRQGRLSRRVPAPAADRGATFGRPLVTIERRIPGPLIVGGPVRWKDKVTI